MFKNKRKVIGLVLFILTILVVRSYLIEYEKNKIYKEEIKASQKTLEKAKKENIALQKEVYSLAHPLEREKERKDKFGEANEGEKVIFLSEDVLKSIEFPFLVK